MKWWASRGTGQEEPQPDVGPRDETHRSVALKKLCQRLSPDRKYNILDLGAAIPGNVDFCSTFAGKLFIENLFETLIEFDFFSPSDGVAYDQVFRYLLPYGPGTRFDVIFGWDLFNYLDAEELRYLMAHLTPFCSPGSLLFALISTKPSIPDRPARYLIEDAETLRYQIAAPGITRGCPRYEETRLLQMMPGFSVGSSFLLRNGFKEFLFQFHR